MSSSNVARVALHSEDQTRALAALLADALTEGDTVLLSGDIGSGKTFLARAVIQHMMGDKVEDVPSPTFTLVQTYQLDRAEIWHADLYRLRDPWELVELGLEDAMSSAICLIEWPDRMGDMAPKDALHITLDPGPGDTERVATLEGRAAKWQPLVGSVSTWANAAS